MTSGVSVEALTLTLGAFHLDKIDFGLSAGETLVILGPNGSGKSVTLETIAGFHRPDSGRVLIANRDVTALPPEQRNVGFVVQNFGLFPHLNVERNVAIARRGARPVAAGDKTLPPQGNIDALLTYFEIAHLARRTPQDLSPGEKQRVALARALAGTPDLFLFDEPFSALDGQTRTQLRDELLSFLRALAIPAIFVTHDPTDALALADKIVILRDGTILQSGPASEIFQKPVNSLVARFVGVENILDGCIVGAAGELATIAVGDRKLYASVPANFANVEHTVRLAIRGEQVIIGPHESKKSMSPAVNQFDGRVTSLRSLNPLVTIEVDCSFPLKGYLLAPQALAMNIEVGKSIAVEIAADAVHVMPD